MFRLYNSRAVCTTRDSTIFSYDISNFLLSASTSRVATEICARRNTIRVRCVTVARHAATPITCARAMLDGARPKWRDACAPSVARADAISRRRAMQQRTPSTPTIGGTTMQANRFTLLVAVTAAVCATATAGHAQVKVTTSAGDVATLSQKNVVDHMIVGDSIEIEEAQLAMTRSQNSAVKDFANMLVTDHKSHLDNLRKLAGMSDIGREANSADSSAASAARAFGQLQSMPADSGFDKAFVNAQVQHHQQEIAALKNL